MLIESGSDVERYLPPSVDELTAPEQERLLSRLSDAVEAWDGTVETGLCLEQLITVEGVHALPALDAAVEYCASEAGVALALPPALCGALVNLTLGAPAEGPKRKLTATDLAILDLWARKAVHGIVQVLSAGVQDKTVRRRGAIQRLAREGDMVIGQLTWAAADEERAGLVVFPKELATSREEDGGRVTLADTPQALLRGTVRMEAMIGGPALPMRELLGVEAGDVLLLGRKRDVEAELCLEGRRLAVGRPGGKSTSRAIRIRGKETADQTEAINEWGTDDDI